MGRRGADVRTNHAAAHRPASGDRFEKAPVEQRIHGDDLDGAGVDLTQQLGVQCRRLGRRLAVVFLHDPSGGTEQLFLWYFVFAQFGGTGLGATRFQREPDNTARRTSGSTKIHRL